MSYWMDGTTTAVTPRASLQSDANNVMSIVVMVMFTIRAAVGKCSLGEVVLEKRLLWPDPASI